MNPDQSDMNCTLYFTHIWKPSHVFVCVCLYPTTISMLNILYVDITAFVMWVDCELCHILHIAISEMFTGY